MANPYLKGTIGLDPGSPEDHLALLKAASLVTNIWVVPGGAYPEHTPGVWPFGGALNMERFQASAVYATTITLKKQAEVPRAQLVTGAMRIELEYEGQLVGPLP